MPTVGVGGLKGARPSVLKVHGCRSGWVSQRWNGVPVSRTLRTAFSAAMGLCEIPLNICSLNFLEVEKTPAKEKG